MGAHFSPCRKFWLLESFLKLDGDRGAQLHIGGNALGASSFPMRHPLAVHQTTYEPHVYSLEETTLSLVLSPRKIRVGYSLASALLSPTPERLLYAYGCHHDSLCCRKSTGKETAIKACTIMEIILTNAPKGGWHYPDTELMRT